VANNAPSLEELRLQFESWLGRQRLSPEAGEVLRQWSSLSPLVPTREKPTDLERSQFRDTLNVLDQLSRSHSIDMASFGRYQQISRDKFGLPSRVVVQTGLTSMVMAGWWKQSRKTSQENVQEIARRFHALQINALVQPSSQRLGVIARLWAEGAFQGKEWQGLEGEKRIAKLARAPERQWRETLQQLGIDPRVADRYSFQTQENREAIIKAGWSGIATRMQAAETKRDILDTLQLGALASGVFGGNREAIETFGKDLLDTLQQVHKEDASLFEDPKKREQLYKTLADKMKGSATALGIGPDQLQKAIQSSYSGLEKNVRLQMDWREMYGNVSRLIGLTDTETLRQVLPRPNLENPPRQDSGQGRSAAPVQSRDTLVQNQPLPLPNQGQPAPVQSRDTRVQNQPLPLPNQGQPVPVQSRDARVQTQPLPLPPRRDPVQVFHANRGPLPNPNQPFPSQLPPSQRQFTDPLVRASPAPMANINQAPFPGPQMANAGQQFLAGQTLRITGKLNLINGEIEATSNVSLL
jgi:hypothetical protein